MADFSHLEKMGRELKCPICLSLLNSSVSLSCNHVFCNTCIEKSMKSASSCPVCKVPYRRREVRPAPHMDNLVSIYKSMEVASGVNIFVTQPKISQASPDEDKQVESTKSKRKRKSRPKEQQKKPSKTEDESENEDREKLSFPTKKRVQVPKYPPSQDLDQVTNSSHGLESIVHKEMPAVNEEEPSYTPFFWLRDGDDVEKPSQLTDPSQNFDTPPNAPCFSDIKDSDDETNNKISPSGEKAITSNNADYYDSEMFEWTQRPCSPELCSSPVKTQVEDTFDLIEIPETETTEASIDASTIRYHENNENKENMVPNQRADGVEDNVLSFLTRKTIKASKGNCGAKKTKNFSKDVAARKKNTGACKIKNVETQLCSEKKAECSVFREHKTNFKPLDPDGLNPSTILKVVTGNGEKLVPENASALSTEEHDMALDNLVANNPPSLKHMEAKSKIHTQKRYCSSSFKGKTQSNSECAGESKKSKKQKTSNNIQPKDKASDGCDGSDEISLKDTQLSKDSSYKCKVKDQIPTSEHGVLRKCDSVPSEVQCAFCHSSEDSEATGEMVHYFNGKPVPADYNGGSKLKHAHRNCTEWAPNVYFEEDNAINLEAELIRSRRIKCCCCDLKGAALGCYETSCRKSFHVPCAKLVPECRWDNDNFVMLCPLHASSKLPNEVDECQTKRKRSAAKTPPPSSKSEYAGKDASHMHHKWSNSRLSGNLVLCCSALTNEEKDFVSKFKKLSGTTILKNWDSRVTHVIASTDENGACRRTLKVLMGILEGKWILGIDWIKACIVAMEPVDEQLYEVGVDIHGVRDGPRLGRLRVLNKQPKLFNGLRFYLTGDFVPSYKGYLHDLLVAAGGTVLNRKPLSTEQKSLSSVDQGSTFIIYSVELPDKSDFEKEKALLASRRSEAEALASASGSIVASNSWVLNSIAAGKFTKL